MERTRNNPFGLLIVPEVAAVLSNELPAIPLPAYVDRMFVPYVTCSSIWYHTVDKIAVDS